MTKILITKVDNCFQCPYCHYDGHYDMSHDSGYDCQADGVEGDGRIINENELKQMDKDLPIPDWCPLPDKEE